MFKNVLMPMNNAGIDFGGWIGSKNHLIKK